ncbi:helix-turn-helix domain-containing protein [Modicisalibacter xianhensis]|uniref:helix-turn-helix domain-containing protein n=1 Tax=Modicisalibacter xianhensis TaxID=442341 RepID=UPI000B83D782|nr:helix-turn-helix domain-containing protein [Halomonas xianhensis]
MPPHRGQPLPATSSSVHQSPNSFNPALAAQGQARSIPSCRPQEHSAIQVTLPQHSDRANCGDIQALVSAACELRHQLRLTQRAFAERLGVNPRTWQEWEQGRRLPSGPARALLEQLLSQQ